MPTHETTTSEKIAWVTITISREHHDFEKDISECFDDKFITEANLMRFSDAPLHMQVMIGLATWIWSNIAWDILKIGLKKFFEKFPKAHATITYKWIMYAIRSDESVKPVVYNEPEYAHIRTTDDLIKHIESTSEVKEENQSEWKETTLGEVANVQTWPFWTQLHEEDYVLDWTPIITVEHLVNNKIVVNKMDVPMVSSEDKRRLDKYVLKEWDIVFSRVWSVDRCGYVSELENGWLFSGRLLRVRAHDDFNKKFVFYWLSQPLIKEFVKKSAVWATMPSINTELLSRVPISIPSLPEQRAIADILSSLDSKIELLREQNEILEKTAQTIFHEWFGRYSIESPEDLPEGWRVGKLEEFIWDIETWKRPKGWVGEIKEWIPSIWAENVKWLLWSSFSSVKLIPEVFFNSMNSGKIKNNDILVYKDWWAPWEFKPNFTIIWDGYPFDIWAINEHVFRVQSKKEYQQYFLFFWLTWRVCTWELKSIWWKAAIPWINGTDFKKLSLLMPNEDYIINFNEKVKPMIKKILSNNCHIQSLSKTRDTLLPKLMSGEVMVV